MSMLFTGQAPNAQKKTKARWQACLNDFAGFIAKNLPASVPSSTISCLGDESDEEDAALNVVANPHRTNHDVELLGEAGAVWQLQAALAKMGVDYDDDNLYKFDGANAFNMVYFDPAPPHATTAIILEAKGGNSVLGERWDSLKLNRVKQGTVAYAQTIIGAMVNSADARRAAIGAELAKLAGTKKVGYIGVQTKYAGGMVSDPVIIFSESF